MFRLAVLATAALAVAEAGPIVQTTRGAVEGVVLGSTHAFLGVPYASPPVGNLRWAAPVEPQAWSGTRNATMQPPGCPQVCVLPPGTCPETTSEDCLYLNVYAPAGAATGLRGAAGGLPVMFFIHGGRFEQGAIGTPLYDGRFLTQFGVVVVEIQYRLGALGFLTTTDLTGNYAILDQQMALRWARDNVAAFGGDPEQVTVFGQSAGAMSVAAHLVSPLSAGLFRAAVMQSDPLVLRYRAQDDAQALGAKFLKELGCDSGSDTLQCLLAAPVPAVLAAQKAAQKHLNLAHVLELFVPWVPTLGEVVPNEPMLAFAEGGQAWNHVPLMIGTVKEDARMFVLEAWNSSLSAFEYHAVATAIFGFEHEKEVVAAFPDEADNRVPLSHLGTDFLFACAARNLALNAAANTTAGDVFQYRFDHVLSFNESWGPNYTFCMGHVCHGSELPFVFGTAALSGFEPTQGELALQKQMMGYWTNFAKTLNPNGPGLPQWPALDNATRTILRLEADAIVPAPGLNHTECDMFDSIGYNRG